MPQTLKSAKDGQIAVKEFYTAGDLAFLMGVAHATAIRLIDQREIRGFWLPTKRRQRRITHRALIAFVRRNPDFRYMLDKLKGYDPRVDFPEGAEPPPPARPIGPAAPWGPEHPRTAKRGQIPQAEYYSAKEVAFLLGLARRTVITKLDAKVIPGLKVRATGLTTWKWRVAPEPRRLRGAEPPLQLRAGPHPGLRGPAVIAPPGRSPLSPREPQAGAGARTRPGAAASSAVPNCPTDASRRRPERTLPPIHGRNGDGCCWCEKRPRKSGRSKRRSMQGLVFFLARVHPTPCRIPPLHGGGKPALTLDSRTA